MWKSIVGHDIKSKPTTGYDNEYQDWDTDPDFVNTVSEKEQRWGSKSIPGSGRVDTFSIAQLREEVKQDDAVLKQKQYESAKIKPVVQAESTRKAAAYNEAVASSNESSTTSSASSASATPSATVTKNSIKALRQRFENN